MLGGYPDEKVRELIACIEVHDPHMASIFARLVERHRKVKLELEEALLKTEKAAATFMKAAENLADAYVKLKAKENK